MKSLVVRLKGSDTIEFVFSDEKNTLLEVRALGCLNLLRLIEKSRPLIFKILNEGQGSIDEFSGQGHEHLLLKEIILKALNRWAPPFGDAEICHCRGISTLDVEQAIVRGCHRVEDVRRTTTANTACGTCRDDIQGMIDYRIK